MMVLSRSLLALAILATGAHAEVYTVDQLGTEDFTTIDDALAAALDGDVILVRGGTYYEEIDIDGKSLTIMAADPLNRPLIRPSGQPLTIFLIENLAADQAVTLDGLRLWVDAFETNLHGAHGALTIEDCDGPVRIQNCELSCSWTWCAGGASSCNQTGGAHVVNSSNVIFLECEILAGHVSCWEDAEGTVSCGGVLKPALKVEGGVLGTKVALFDCHVQGAPGRDPADPDLVDGWAGGDAAQVTDSFLFASNTIFEGGEGSDADEASQAHLPGVGGDGGHALVLSGATVTQLNCLLLGGTPGFGSPCNSCNPQLPPGADGIPGASISGCCADTLTGALRTAEIAGNQLLGDQLQVTFRGEPGDQVDLLAADSGGFLYQAQRLGVYGLEGPATSLGGVNGLGTLPASGELTLLVNLPAGPTDQLLDVQAVFTSSSGVKALGPSRRVLDSPGWWVWPHCQSTLNSGGTTAGMGVTGTPSISANDMHMVATHLPPLEMGMFFYGLAPTTGWSPLGDGKLCVAAPHYRFQPALQAGALGTVHLALDLTAPPMDAGPGAVAAGQRVYFQYVYRDANSAGNSGFNLTNGVTVEFCP